jgi:uncharacterized protein with HEPN domain
MRPDELIRLRHIADALNSAIGLPREGLNTDPKLVFAIIHAIQIAGEAASRISTEMREQRFQPGRSRGCSESRSPRV